MKSWVLTPVGFVLRTLKAMIGAVALLSFLLAVFFGCEGVLALFAAYRVHTTGQFHGLPYTATHDVRVAVGAFMIAAVFLWQAHIFRPSRRSRRIQSTYKRSDLD